MVSDRLDASTRTPIGCPNVTGLAVGVGVWFGVGVGATVKLQVTSCRASATAVPAASADGNTTCGQEKVGRPSHGCRSRKYAW